MAMKTQTHAVVFLSLTLLACDSPGADPSVLDPDAVPDETSDLVSDDADSTGVASQAIIGFDNDGAPEIGLITDAEGLGNPAGYCTGTAIAPHVVLTARHCPGRFFFTIQPGLNVQRFTTRERWDSPDYDVSLLRIWETIPWTRPIKEHGPVNATAAVWGFGGNACGFTNDGQWYDGGVGRKRVGFFTTQPNGWISPNVVCGGDSGGPIIDWNDGQIFGVTSRVNLVERAGWFEATNRRDRRTNLWNDLMFSLWVWQ
jgi:hypothetical protein